MKYFIDTEFLEGPQTKRIFGIAVGKTKPTIDLISIGIVAEDGREYYAVSREFNLREAWDRYQEEVNMDYKPNMGGGSDGPYNPMYIRTYWIRENVLKPIFKEYAAVYANGKLEFTYANMKLLINEFGLLNSEIAEEIKVFTSKHRLQTEPLNIEADTTPKKFYAYYADYDWVAFCWLFGKMIDLPDGYPMFCIDLKQMFDDKVAEKIRQWGPNAKAFDMPEHIKTLPNYPKQQANPHHALSDAHWDKELHDFLAKI